MTHTGDAMPIDPIVVRTMILAGHTIQQIADRFRVGVGAVDNAVRLLLR